MDLRTFFQGAEGKSDESNKSGFALAIAVLARFRFRQRSEP